MPYSYKRIDFCSKTFQLLYLLLWPHALLVLYISFKVIDCCWPLAVVLFFWFWINSIITFGFFIIWRFTRSLWMYKCTDWSTEYHVRKGYGYRNWRWCDYIMFNLQLKAILICENSVRVRIIRNANFQKWLGRMGKILCKSLWRSKYLKVFETIIEM